MSNSSTITAPVSSEPFIACEAYRYDAMGRPCLGRIFNRLDRQIVSLLARPIKQPFDFRQDIATRDNIREKTSAE